MASSPWPSCLAASLTSDIFFYVIIGWVKREGPPPFMQMLNIVTLGREIRTEMFCKLFPVPTEIASV